MEPICFTWNLGIFRNLYLEPLLGTSEPSGTLYDWNPYLEPPNLPEPLTSEPSEPYLEPLLGTLEPAGTFTWNPYSEPRNLPEPLLGTLTWNLGALWHNLTHGVRSQPPQRLGSTSSCTFISPRYIDALLRSFVSSMEYSLRMIVPCWSFYCNGGFEAACSWNLAYTCNLSQLYADP